MRVSFISTVFNEEESIDALLDSIFEQSHPADEIIITDGGSVDKTVEKIKRKFAKQKRIKCILLEKKGDRAVGRNEAIKQATGDIIAISDAGCILDENWIKNITEPFRDQKIDVVAGYYGGKAKTPFQKCLVPYVLVMEDKVDSGSFLPATRSMALRKFVWKEAGGFPEKYSHNEDYVFAHTLKNKGFNIFFQKTAIVSWIPPNTLRAAFRMFYRFAMGDIESGLIRKKVVFIFLRYGLALYLLLLLALYKSIIVGAIMLALFAGYLFWSINKNYKYVKQWRACYLLPVLQFSSDAAVILGSLAGAVKKLINFIFKFDD